jgi:hypothetical protein
MVHCQFLPSSIFDSRSAIKEPTAMLDTAGSTDRGNIDTALAAPQSS